MNFSEQPPSQEWAALTCRGERIAEVWFKSEGEPFGLTFRVPQQSFQIPGMGQRLTTTAPTPNFAIPSRSPHPAFPT